MKDLHIVFGVQARAVISGSNIYKAGDTELACFEDTLSIGPIADLDKMQGIENRVVWMKQLKPAFAGEIADFIMADIDLINTLKDSIHQYKRIYLWAGSDMNEILGASRFLHSLEKGPPCPIFIIDFLNTSLTQRDSEFVYPKSLKETAFNQIEELYEHFKPLEGLDFQKMQSLWKKLSSNHANLRVVHHDEISGSETDYYDASILVHCTKRYQIAIKVVGKTLGRMNAKSINEGIVDPFLNWRLKNLIEQNKLKYRGDMSSMRTYEVKLV